MQITGLQPIFHRDTRSDAPLVIAGPCSAETREQTVETARQVAATGVEIYRAGVWKPRTKPGGFEGMGSEALEWLREAKEQTGLKTITEAANRLHLEEAVKAGTDGIWIGARTAANPFAVQEIADGLEALPEERKKDFTVLVKNPVNPDIELWIGAIERIYGSGIRRIGAIHRGFSTYGRHLYRNRLHWGIPIELRRRIPGIPILFDPSHAGGRRDLVGRLAHKAMDIDFDGLMIETHMTPEKALSDAAQQVTPAELAEILSTLQRRTHSPSTESLDDLRRKIDGLDDRLLELLAKRMDVAREIGRYKLDHRLPVVQMDRYNDLMEKRVKEGESLELRPDFVRLILSIIHEESVHQQTDLEK